MSGFLQSVLHAFSGVRQFVRERNAKIMVAGVCIAAVMAAGAPSWLWRALLVFSAAFVLAVEMINSAMERMLDYVAPRKSFEVKYIKDMMAGASLVACSGAFGIGVMFLFAYFGG